RPRFPALLRRARLVEPASRRMGSADEIASAAPARRTAWRMVGVDGTDLQVRGTPGHFGCRRRAEQLTAIRYGTHASMATALSAAPNRDHRRRCDRTH